jgi:hypothetical protein
MKHTPAYTGTQIGKGKKEPAWLPAYRIRYGWRGDLWLEVTMARACAIEELLVGLGPYAGATYTKELTKCAHSLAMCSVSDRSPGPALPFKQRNVASRTIYPSAAPLDFSSVVDGCVPVLSSLCFTHWDRTLYLSCAR